MLIIEKLDNNIDRVSFNRLDKINAPVADDIKSDLSRLFDVPNAKIIIDLHGIKYIDSSGFGCFLTTLKAARNNYGKLKICNIEPGVLAVFKTLQLHTIIDLCDDLDSCLNSF
ncbi:MAG: STAS domain-containing protein [Bacteroidales bacterium]|nr:STAS domain-containing protein [Bacteroidales bacterium]